MSLSWSSSSLSPDTFAVVGSVIASPASSDGLFAVIPSCGAVAKISVDSFAAVGIETPTVEPGPDVSGPRSIDEKVGKSVDVTVDDDAMTNITRPEFEAKLEAIEARMDGRVASIELKIDGFLSAQAERDKRFERELELGRQQADRQLLQMEQRFQGMDTSIGEIKSSLSAQKYWLAGIGVAVILGIMGANATIFSGAKSFFDGGVEQAEIRKLVEEIQAQSAETRALIKRIDSDPAATLPGAPSAGNTVPSRDTTSTE